jgi:hypothetical protein
VVSSVIVNIWSIVPFVGGNLNVFIPSCPTPPKTIRLLLVVIVVQDKSPPEIEPVPAVIALLFVVIGRLNVIV